MKARRFTLLVVFALLAGGTASWLSLAYVRGLSAAEPAQVATAAVRQVAVAARDLAPGTVIAAADVQLVDWALETVPVALSTAVEPLVGRTVLMPISAAEPIASAFLAAAGAGPGVAGLIPDGMRAVSLPVDNIVGVNGFVLPGTRVDVLATIERGAGAEPETRILLQDVEVLAAGHALQPDAQGTPQEVAVMTVLVTPQQAERLVYAMHRGRMQLALRNRLDTAHVPVAAPRPAVTPATAPAASAPAAPAAHQPHIVEVYRGTDRSVVQVPGRGATEARR